VLRWNPDGSGIAAVTPAGGSANVIVQPLGGDPVRQITHFTEGRVLGFGWSMDGAQLPVVPAKRHGDAVLITKFQPTCE
jgi:Tol biopolymer transport system component